MRTIKLLVVAVAVAAGCVFALDGGDASALSRGPFLEHSNAPGEANCTQCHRTYPLDSGQGRVEILGLPAQYEPSHVYPITVRVSDPIAREWGFQITAITDDGAACGFFQTETLGVQALGPSIEHHRFYAEHTIYGVYAGQAASAEWQFMWKAPSQDLGPAHFYAVGNGANGDHTDFYDYIYSTVVTIDGQTKSVRVALVSPTGGNRLGSGERAEIQWTATNGDAAIPQAFRVLLSTDGGENYPTVLASNLPAEARSFAWDVPDALTTSSARVRVVAVDSLGVEHADQSHSDVVIEPIGLDRVSPTIALPAGGSARAGAWADVDGNGRPDVAIARSAGGPLLLEQTEQGTFVDATVSSGIASIGDARAVAWGDANGDGRPDLAVVSPSSIVIYLNDGQGGFTNVGAPTPLPRPADPRSVAWADVDADGRQDLLVATSNGLVALRNAPEGFTDASALWGSPSGSFASVAVGPLVAVGGASGVALLEFRAGRFVDVSASARIVGLSTVQSLVWADVNGDGALDLLVGSTAGLDVFLAEGGEGARFVDRSTQLGLDGLDAISSISVGDFDLDGSSDLFVEAGGAPRVYRNHPGLAFQDVTARFELDAGTMSAVWVDLDGGGSADLVAIGASSAVAFTNPRSSADLARISAPIGTVVRADVDGDGAWGTGGKGAAVVDGTGVVAFVAPLVEHVLVRVEAPGRGGRQVTADVGAPPLAVDPGRGPTVDSVRLAGAKLVLDGSGLPLVASMEVAGVAVAKVKAPVAFRESDGSTRRLVGRDPSIPATVAAGPVAVQVLDSATGVLTRTIVVR